jgi:hypothetical protein
MVRRTSPRKTQDDQAFPIRIRIDNPWSGAGSLRWSEADSWLRERVGAGHYAVHGDGQRQAFYFRTAEAAHRFCAAFPDLVLADYTDHVDYLRSARSQNEPDSLVDRSKLPQ